MSSSAKPTGFSFFRTFFEKVILKNAGRYSRSLVLNLWVWTPAEKLTYTMCGGKKNISNIQICYHVSNRDTLLFLVSSCILRTSSDNE